jgi:hypothetical protein
MTSSYSFGIEHLIVESAQGIDINSKLLVALTSSPDLALLIPVQAAQMACFRINAGLTDVKAYFGLGLADTGRVLVTCR